MDVMHIIARMIPGSQYVYGALKLNTTAPEATKFFKDVITQSIRMRKESKERKNDLIDLMLDVMKEDNKEEDKDECEDQYEKDMKLNNNGRRRKQIDFIPHCLCRGTCLFHTSFRIRTFFSWFLIRLIPGLESGSG